MLRELSVLAFVYNRHLVDRGREGSVGGAGGLEDRVLLLLGPVSLEPVGVVETLRQVLGVVHLRGSLQSLRGGVCLQLGGGGSRLPLCSRGFGGFACLGCHTARGVF